MESGAGNIGVFVSENWEVCFVFLEAQFLSCHEKFFKTKLRLHVDEVMTPFP